MARSVIFLGTPPPANTGFRDMVPIEAVCSIIVYPSCAYITKCISCTNVYMAVNIITPQCHGLRQLCCYLNWRSILYKLWIWSGLVPNVYKGCLVICAAEVETEERGVTGYRLLVCFIIMSWKHIYCHIGSDTNLWQCTLIATLYTLAPLTEHTIRIMTPRSHTHVTLILS